MSLIIHSFKADDDRGFTLVETMLAAVIGVFVMMAIWGVYMMSSQWWAEIGPRLDAEKAARMTLLSVIEGSVDADAGAYTVGPTTYTRRNGIAWATGYPDISPDGRTISYRLVPDSSNVRQFYYGTFNGNGYIFYKNSDGDITRLDATKGVTDIQFSIIGNHNNIVQVVVTAEKSIYGTRKLSPYVVSVTYTDTVYLRNAL